MSARTQRHARLVLLPLLVALTAALLGPPSRARADILDEAILLLQSGQSVEAELIFEALAEEFPDSALPHYYLGVAASRRGDPRAAALAFERAAEIDPELPWVQANLGIALQRMGESDRAEPHLWQALLQGPEDPDVLIHLGLIEDARDEYAKATKLFVRAAELDPELSALAWYHAAESQLALGRTAPAREYLEAALVAAGPAGAREAASELLLELDGAGAEPRPWRLRAGLGLEVDDNLTVPELDAATGISDIAGVFEAGVALDPWRGERTSISMGYDFYQSVYRDLDALNLQSHAPGLVLGADVGWLSGTIGYRYSHEDIGGEAFLRSQHVSGSIGRQVLRAWSGELAVEYESLDFPLAPRRDADRVAFGIGQQLGLADGRLDLSLDWRVEWQDATAPSLDYFENAVQLGAGANLPLWSRPLGLSAYYRYQHRRYAGVLPRIDEQRLDQRHYAGTSLVYPITRWVDVVADYLFIASRSNVPILTYDENVFTLRVVLWY